jgi:glyoxylase-like metal-dependent hydrolase (beta-lactamase superfamily II)
MQLLRVDSAGQVFVYLADLVPTRHHLDYPWVMGYDLYPVETLRQKKALLPQAAREDWIVGFAHDPDVPFGRVRLDGARPVLEPA